MMWEKKGLLVGDSLIDKKWMETHYQLPIAMDIDNETFRLYFNARIKGKSYPSYADIDKKTLKVQHVADKPLLMLGKAGTFDDSGIMFSSYIKMKGDIYMYYIGWNVGHNVSYKNSIGLAISHDGIHFEKYSEAPILDRNINDAYFVASPNVISTEDGFRMYYLSTTAWKNINNRMEPQYLIKYADSVDGIVFHSNQQVCIDYEYEGEAIACPWVIKDNNKYQMWYSTRKMCDYRENKNNSYRLGYAESSDGTNWIRKDNMVGIDVSASGWDSEMLCYASVYKFNNEKIMFYNGNGFGQSGIGYAVEKCK